MSLDPLLFVVYVCLVCLLHAVMEERYRVKLDEFPRRRHNRRRRVERRRRRRAYSNLTPSLN